MIHKKKHLIMFGLVVVEGLLIIGLITLFAAWFASDNGVSLARLDHDHNSVQTSATTGRAASAGRVQTDQDSAPVRSQNNAAFISTLVERLVGTVALNLASSGSGPGQDKTVWEQRATTPLWVNPRPDVAAERPPWVDPMDDTATPQDRPPQRGAPRVAETLAVQLIPSSPQATGIVDTLPSTVAALEPEPIRPDGRQEVALPSQPALTAAGTTVGLSEVLPKTVAPTMAAGLASASGREVMAAEMLSPTLAASSIAAVPSVPPMLAKIDVAGVVEEVQPAPSLSTLEQNFDVAAIQNPAPLPQRSAPTGPSLVEEAIESERRQNIGVPSRSSAAALSGDLPEARLDPNENKPRLIDRIPTRRPPQEEDRPTARGPAAQRATLSSPLALSENAERSQMSEPASRAIGAKRPRLRVPKPTTNEGKAERPWAPEIKTISTNAHIDTGRVREPFRGTALGPDRGRVVLRGEMSRPVIRPSTPMQSMQRTSKPRRLELPLNLRPDESLWDDAT